MACDSLSVMSKWAARSLWMTSVVLLFSAKAVWAQNADENAVAEAEDAFGFTVGNETVGLYSSASVRGFSPISANNVRIDSLYFDQQGPLVYNAFDSSSIEVGLNARGYVLPNPSGVVDFRLRRPGARDAVSLTAGVDPFTSPYISATISMGGRDKPGLAGRLAYYPRGNNAQGGQYSNFTAGVAGFTSLRANLDISVFAEIEDYQGQSSPTYFSLGPYLPPPVPRGKFLGQPWALYEYRTTNAGAILDWQVDQNSEVRFGLFRSTYDLRSGAYDLVTGLDRAGNGRRLIYVFPPEMDVSISGEVQYRRIIETGRFRVTGTASVRGRTVDRQRREAAIVNLGDVNLDRLVVQPEQEFNFGAEVADAVNQIGFGLHSRIQWNQRLDISLGVQKSEYAKAVIQDEVTESMASSPWLYQVLAAWSVSPNLVVYVSASNGLEESGTAPAQAANRGEVLPATITDQQEIGFRLTRGPMTLTASGFALAKPYPNLNPLGQFDFIGIIRHRGVELSLAGQPINGLDLLAGALYLNAEVDQTVDKLRRSFPAVGQPRYRLLLSANYQLPETEKISLDGSVTFQGGRVAKLNPVVQAPDYALLNAGIRYQIRPNIVARAELRNIFDTYGYTVSSTSAFGYVPGRSVRLALTWTL